MDAMTWNSYHIISNRARSICYATRQQQFRLKTEYTVNQLANQAENQMHLMDHLQVRLLQITISHKYSGASRKTCPRAVLSMCGRLSMRGALHVSSFHVDGGFLFL